MLSESILLSRQICGPADLPHMSFQSRFDSGMRIVDRPLLRMGFDGSACVVNMDLIQVWR